MIFLFFFFFQAEDGIRDHCVTGVQTCALPISTPPPAAESLSARAWPYRAKKSATPGGRSRPGCDATDSSADDSRQGKEHHAYGEARPARGLPDRPGRDGH